MPADTAGLTGIKILKPGSILNYSPVLLSFKHLLTIAINGIHLYLKANPKEMKKIFYLLAGLVSLCGPLVSQNAVLRGIAYDHLNQTPLPFTNVYIEGSSLGTLTDLSGKFSIQPPEQKGYLVLRYVGFRTERIEFNTSVQTDLGTIHLSPDLIAFTDEVVVVGSRSYPRTTVQSAVPVDVFPSSVLFATGQQDLSQQINSLSPSFYSARMTFSDATDHMDPAALRGLNPDQTLILVNGKRHHPSAVVNVLSVVGRGSVINDLNTIPSGAIERVEILRDGASAQYGSDAIAGVINLVLREDTAGARIRTRFGQYFAGDGFERNLSASFGAPAGNGGFIHLTAAYTGRDATNRAGTYQGLVFREAGQEGLSYEENLEIDNGIIASRGLTRDDFSLRLGNSDLKNMNIFLNSAFPLSKESELYLFGGLNHRYSKSTGDFRLPGDESRNNINLYPNGFLPAIHGKLNDRFVSSGLRTELRGWDLDMSNTYGFNRIDFYVRNSLNASMGEDSPRSFESGGLVFSQNTIDLDISRKFGSERFFESLNLSMGGEYRIENYRIISGEEASWINEDQLAYPGAQGFPGYQPDDETDQSRTNAGLFADASLKFNSMFLVEGALRYEEYSDFGDKLTGKLAMRFSPLEILGLRGSVSTGFRAPSLHQRYYSNTGTYYFFGTLFEVLTAANESRVAEAFGIPPLAEENSVSLSLGMSLKPLKNMVITADLYQVDVDDRIVLSGTFWSFIPSVGTLLQDLPGVGAAQFFTNAIDTRTRGLDIVFSQQIDVWKGIAGISLGANLNETMVRGEIKASDKLVENGLEGLLFDRQARAILELAQPRSKVSGTLNYQTSRFSVTLRNIWFGKVSYRGTDESTGELAKDQDYSPRLLSDLKLGFQLNKNLNFYLGANNLFDVYPDKNVAALRNNGNFPYNTAVTQFGFNGGFVYGGLEFIF